MTGYYTNEKQKINEGYHFELCSKGTYLKEGGKDTCDVCEIEGECEGGYIPLVPKKGYWRDISDPYKLYECTHLDGYYCRGNDTCYEGHTGVLCEECNILNGWTKTQTQECQQCNPPFTLYIQLVSLFVGFTGFIMFAIDKAKTRLEERNKKKYFVKIWDYIILNENQITGIIKIFVNHCQIIYISTNIELPNIAIGFVGFISNPGENAGSNLTCLQQKDKYNEKLMSVEQSIMGGVIEISVTFLIILSYSILYKFKALKKLEYQGLLISTLVVTFIMIQPGIVKNAFKFLMCRKIGDKKYSVVNTNIECYEMTYLTTVAPIYGGILIFMLIIFPFIIFVILYQKRKNLNSIKMQRYFGILILDFKYKWWYWEFVNLYLKTLISFVSMYFIDHMIIKSCITTIIVLTQCVLLQKIKPQNSGKITNLAIQSGLIQATTFVFELAQYNPEDDMKIMYIIGDVMISAANIYFIFRVAQLIYPHMEYKAIQYYIKIFGKYFSQQTWEKIQKNQDKKNQVRFNWLKIRIAVKKFNALRKIQQLEGVQYNILMFEYQKNDAAQSIIERENIKNYINDQLSVRGSNLWLRQSMHRGLNNDEMSSASIAYFSQINRKCNSPLIDTPTQFQKKKQIVQNNSKNKKNRKKPKQEFPIIIYPDQQQLQKSKFSMNDLDIPNLSAYQSYNSLNNSKYNQSSTTPVNNGYQNQEFPNFSETQQIQINNNNNNNNRPSLQDLDKQSEIADNSCIQQNQQDFNTNQQQIKQDQENINSTRILLQNEDNSQKVQNFEHQKQINTVQQQQNNSKQTKASFNSISSQEANINKNSQSPYISTYSEQNIQEDSSSQPQQHISYKPSKFSLSSIPSNQNETSKKIYDLIQNFDHNQIPEKNEQLQNNQTKQEKQTQDNKQSVIKNEDYYEKFDNQNSPQKTQHQEQEQQYEQNNNTNKIENHENNDTEIKQIQCIGDNFNSLDSNDDTNEKSLSLIDIL